MEVGDVVYYEASVPLLPYKPLILAVIRQINAREYRRGNHKIENPEIELIMYSAF
jgi:hypothetical protein